MTTPLLLLPLLNCINPPELGITIRRAPINKFLLPISPNLNIKKKKIANYYLRRCTKCLIIKKNDVEITIGEEQKGAGYVGRYPIVNVCGGDPIIIDSFPATPLTDFGTLSSAVLTKEPTRLMRYKKKRVQDSSSDDDKV